MPVVLLYHRSFCRSTFRVEPQQVRRLVYPVLGVSTFNWYFFPSMSKINSHTQRLRSPVHPRIHPIAAYLSLSFVYYVSVCIFKDHLFNLVTDIPQANRGWISRLGSIQYNGTVDLHRSYLLPIANIRQALPDCVAEQTTSIKTITWKHRDYLSFQD